MSEQNSCDAYLNLIFAQVVDIYASYQTFIIASINQNRINTTYIANANLQISSSLNSNQLHTWPHFVLVLIT